MKGIKSVLAFLSKLGKYGGLIVSVLSIIQFATKELEKFEDKKEVQPENLEKS